MPRKHRYKYSVNSGVRFHCTSLLALYFASVPQCYPDVTLYPHHQALCTTYRRGLTFARCCRQGHRLPVPDTLFKLQQLSLIQRGVQDVQEYDVSGRPLSSYAWVGLQQSLDATQADALWFFGTGAFGYCSACALLPRAPGGQ